MQLLDPLAPATIDWRDDGPWSVRFDDRYASTDALAEARHVFVDGNDLPRRFAGLGDQTTIARPAPPHSLRIAEIGFGFGVNFLVTLRHWRAHAAPGAALHYLALEHTPVARDDLVRRFEALDLLTDAEPLLASLPPALTGFWRIAWPRERVFLTLGYGDAATLLADRDSPLGIDAWYLDGFSPRRNADAFTDPGLLDQIARHSAPAATLTTYSAAGAVRRSLQAHGWVCARRPGFGHKREHLVARREHATRPDRPRADAGAPAVSRVHAANPVCCVDVAIVGAGLAGRLVAAALADRGARVAILDDGQLRASDSPAALAHPGLRRSQTELEAASLLGLQALRSRLAGLTAEQRRQAVHACADDGLVHRVTRVMRRRLTRVLAPATPRDHAYRRRLREAGWVDDVSEVSDAPRQAAAIVYPQGLALDLGAFCRALAATWSAVVDTAGQRAVTRIRARARRLDRETIADQTLWRVTLDRPYGVVARAVVLATGGDVEGLRRLIEDAPIATSARVVLHLASGQLDHFRIAPATRVLARPAAGDGFVVPQRATEDPTRTAAAWVGASYRLAVARSADIGPALRDASDDTPCAPDRAGSPPPASAAETAGHRQRLQEALAVASGETPALIHDGVWTGRRAVTPDRVPWIGALADGLWLAVGFGSHGSTLAPFAAEVIADVLGGGIPPWSAAQKAVFDPRRHLDPGQTSVATPAATDGAQRRAGATAS